MSIAFLHVYYKNRTNKQCIIRTTIIACVLFSSNTSIHDYFYRINFFKKLIGFSQSRLYRIAISIFVKLTPESTNASIKNRNIMSSTKEEKKCWHHFET